MQIQVTGLKEIQDELTTLDKKAHDTQPLMEELGNHLKNVIEESFEAEASPAGVKWTPIKFRKNDPHPEKILYAHGKLQEGTDYKATNKSVVVGVYAKANGYQYPIVHQFGSLKKSGRGSGVVARPFMPIKVNGELYEKTQKELEQIVEDYFELMGLKK
jgi:phage virion morphogenesis protein